MVLEKLSSADNNWQYVQCVTQADQIGLSQPMPTETRRVCIMMNWDFTRPMAMYDSMLNTECDPVDIE
jgi:hypothetical protein